MIKTHILFIPFSIGAQHRCRKNPTGLLIFISYADTFWFMSVLDLNSCIEMLIYAIMAVKY